MAAMIDIRAPEAFCRVPSHLQGYHQHHIRAVAPSSVNPQVGTETSFHSLLIVAARQTLHAFRKLIHRDREILHRPLSMQSSPRYPRTFLNIVPLAAKLVGSSLVANLQKGMGQISANVANTMDLASFASDLWPSPGCCLLFEHHLIFWGLTDVSPSAQPSLKPSERQCRRKHALSAGLPMLKALLFAQFPTISFHTFQEIHSTASLFPCTHLAIFSLPLRRNVCKRKLVGGWHTMMSTPEGKRIHLPCRRIMQSCPCRCDQPRLVRHSHRLGVQESQA
jgi:hypothetical protein